MKLRIVFLFFCLLICGTLVAAAPHFFVDGSTRYEQDYVIGLERSLNFSRVPMTSTWTVTILPEDKFIVETSRLDLDTDTAYTFLGGRHTFINEGYLQYGTDSQIRWTLGHEAGHLACECSSEETANEIAHELTK